MSRRAAPAATALALAVAAACAAAAAAQAAPAVACAAGLTAAQCTVCARAGDPRKCQACTLGAKPSSDKLMVALTCMVCASVAGKAAQDTCSACVAAQGWNKGCSLCAGASLYGLASDAKPGVAGLATSSGCFSCYAKGPAELLSTPACVACYAPPASDPASCSACVAGATGLPAAARASCYGCYVKGADAGSCAACLKGVTGGPAAALCTTCATAPAAAGSAAAQKQCYACAERVAPNLLGVKFLCSVTGSSEKNAPLPALTAAAPRYFDCLAAARTLDAGQACRRCMDDIEKSGAAAGAACFAKLAA